SGSFDYSGNEASNVLFLLSDRNVYCEDWGEALTNKSTPAICVVSLRSGSLDVLSGIPADISPGQARWAPGSQSVFFIGWYHEPFRLGLKFCSNRSALDELNSLASWPYEISQHSHKLVTVSYLHYSVSNTFGKCAFAPDGFAGVYEALPSSCWSADGQRVVFSSACQNRKVKHHFYGLSDAIYGSWKLLTIQKDLMVVCCSSPNTPPTMLVGFLPSVGEAVTWHKLQQPIQTFDFLWTVLEVEPLPEEDNQNYPGLKFGAVLVKPRVPLPGAQTPLVVFIHGGPHSQFAAEWNTTTAGLVSLGFAVLMVNYRGSIGFGQDSILSLIGHIGSQDVQDVQRAVLAALHSHTTLDASRVAVIGGSHGGFLSCHLVAQYPEFYRVCAARNPVINAATLLGTSDIVDWRYTCVGLQYSYNQTPTAEALAAMLEKSPIMHAAQIKAPVLLMLGGRDRRVSPYQGLELYKVLKSRAAPVRLLWFAEDGHSLSRVDTQAQCFINVALWLHQYL
uniref:acylaminoacyl-peptidase n=1 Tax=Hippocampus comes TaxID=109280 RepID=A0A3Q2YTJ2_HIPCM